MTVQSENTLSGPLYPNGSTTTFPFTFAARAAGDVAVLIDGGTVNPGLYSVTLAADFNSGSVVFTQAPTGGTLYIVSAPSFEQQISFQNQGAFLPTAHDAANDRAAIRDLWLKGQADRSLKLPVGSIAPALPGLPGNGGKVLGLSADASSLLWLTQGGADSALRTDLATLGGSLVAYSLGTTGAKVQTVDVGLKKTVWASDFQGVDPTGATNSTTGLKRFFDYCIANQADGLIPAGTYLVTPGQLVFDNGFVETPWPNIYTAGYAATVLKVDPATSSSNNAPILKISNGTGTGGNGLWLGGFIGGLTFLDQTGHTTATSRHGIELRGMQGTVFGHFRGQGLSGSTVSIDYKVAAGNNPDPYHVAACQFQGIELYNGAGRILTNANGQGFNGNRIWFLRGIQTQAGGLKGFGAGNRVDYISMGGCAGVALDADTTNWSTLFGFDVGEAELDDCEYAIRLQKYRGFSFFGRIIHRYNGSALNTSNKYWPLKSVDVGVGVGGSVTEANIVCEHRIDAGGTLADIGVFTDFNSTGTAGYYSRDSIIDNPGLGVPDSGLYSNFNVSGSGDVRMERDGKIILRNTKRRAAYAFNGGSATIANSGTGTAAAILAFSSERYDESGDYNTGTYGFTAPWTGKCKFTGQFFAPVPTATQFIRFYVLLNRGGSYSTVLYGREYHGTTNAELHQLSGEFEVLAGDILYFAADTNAPAPQAVTAILGQASDNFAQYEMVE